MEESSLIQNLTLILVTASFVSIIFSMLHWPTILGYLLSGVLVHSYFPTHCDENHVFIQSISELGVIFLMFCVGLEFDLKKLKQTLLPCLLAMCFQACMGFFLGITVARIIRLSATLGLFLGAIFSISSTMVAIPIIKQQNALQQPFAQFTIGIAILEDIFAIVLLSVLSSIQNGNFGFGKCLNLIFWITIFMVSITVFGRLIANRIIAIFKKISNQEVMNVCTIGIVLLLSYISDGYSNALGAFLAGVIFSNTQIIHHLGESIAPIRDIFSSIFFVSIGMLIDCRLLWQYKWVILVLTVLVVVGQLISAWFGFFLGGQKGELSFRASLPKAQIGEFSFVIAALASTLGLDNGLLMTITIGVAVFSIIAVNILCIYEDSVLKNFEKMVPKGLKTLGHTYQVFLHTLQTTLSTSRVISIARVPLFKIVLHFLIINAIVFCGHKACDILEHTSLNYVIWLQRGTLLLTLFLSLPFINCIVSNLNNILTEICQSVLKKNLKRAIDSNSIIYRITKIVLLSTATIIFIWAFLMVSAQYLPHYIPIVALIAIGIIVGVVFCTNLRKLNSKFELSFLNSFSEALEEQNERRHAAAIKLVETKHPWPVKVRRVSVKPTSQLVGLTLANSQLREQTHTLLLGIIRNSFCSNYVAPDHVFYPGDILVLLGTEEQLNLANKWINLPQTTAVSNDVEFDLDQVIVTDNHPFNQATLASLDLRRKFSVNVVGIQRKKERIQELHLEDMFKAGDSVFLVGSRKNLDAVKHMIEANS